MKYLQKVFISMLSLLIMTACSSSEDEVVLEIQYSAFISAVYDYQYAPGQHISKINTPESFIGDPYPIDQDPHPVTYLGGWGGFIEAGFDHEITNEEGADFGVYTQPGTGTEPAVVYVMTDANKDGKPNDGEWIQLKGSEFSHKESIQNYEVTYFKAKEGEETLRWEDNQGNTGELKSYYAYPASTWWWNQTKEQVTFTGVKLPEAFYLKGAGWVNYEDRFLWGYAENYQGEDHDPNLRANLFDISNAVDAEGNKVALSSIKFIKVQTGVFQIAGHFNEVSTEIRGAFDYRMLTGKE